MKDKDEVLIGILRNQSMGLTNDFIDDDCAINSVYLWILRYQQWSIISITFEINIFECISELVFRNDVHTVL